MSIFGEHRFAEFPLFIIIFFIHFIKKRSRIIKPKKRNKFRNLFSKKKKLYKIGAHENNIHIFTIEFQVSVQIQHN